MFGGGLSSRASGSMIQEANEETLIRVREVSRYILAAFLALIATVLTSFLPILNKHLLRDARPALVAWITNAASLPILAAEAYLFTQTSIPSPPVDILRS